jgi:hypothetical protein
MPVPGRFTKSTFVLLSPFIFLGGVCANVVVWADLLCFPR